MLCTKPMKLALKTIDNIVEELKFFLSLDLLLLPLQCDNCLFLLLFYLFHSYHIGVELLRSDSLGGGDSMLKSLWHHENAILCCSLKVRTSAIFLIQNLFDMNFTMAWTSELL